MGAQIGAMYSALVVDDEEAVCEALREILEDMAFSVTAVSTITAAEPLTKDDTFDLLLIDKNLPDGSGIDFIQRLHRDNRAIVVISGYANLTSAVEAIGLGVADYILKPFDLDDFVARIGRVMTTLTLRRAHTVLLTELDNKNKILEKLVASDPLTGLYNHAFFRERLGQELARCARKSAPMSIVLFDITDFKRINETHGHLLGDAVLVALARAFQGRASGFPPLREQDVFARYGADEIAVMLPDTDRSGGASLAARIRTAIESLAVEELGETIKTTAGVSSFPEDGQAPDSLLAAVEIASLAAKKPGSGGLVGYSEALSVAGKLQRRAAEKLAGQSRALNEAIFARSLEYHYQPIVSSKSGDVMAYECLVRPARDDFAHPGELFEVAERCAQLHNLGRVLREICVAPMDRLNDTTRLFINLHPRDLYDPQLLAGEPFLLPWASRIVFEVTEVEAIDDFGKARGNLEILRRHGFAIAVDDFGAGYSGLNNLALLNPDFVKLDMAFIRGIDRNQRLGRLVGHICEFANAEGMHVIAEGVETRDELKAVCELGAHYIQGYYLGRPAPAFVDVDSDLVTL